MPSDERRSGGHDPACRDRDLAAVRRLVREAGLPAEGLEEQFGTGYAVAETTGRVIGAAGVEVHGDCGILRAAVLDPAWRGRGIGDALTRDRIAWAAAAGLRAMYLLTTTAADYFPRFGFVRVERESAPAAVRASGEFASLCPASAVAMRLALADPRPGSAPARAFPSPPQGNS